MKTSPDFFKVWGGVAGVQSTLPILLTHEPALPFLTIAALTSANIADRYQVPNKGKIEVGMDADLALIQTDASFTLKRDDLFDRHKLSPYIGRKFRGIVRKTLLRGNVIFDDGRIVGEHKGRLVTPIRR